MENSLKTKKLQKIWNDFTVGLNFTYKTAINLEKIFTLYISTHISSEKWYVCYYVSIFIKTTSEYMTLIWKFVSG